MNHHMEVYTSADAFQEEELRGKTVVMIDVLRASTTITAALENGAKGIIPVGDMDAAGRISQNLDSSHYLLCGEKDGVKIEGYDLGNSPLEYTPEAVKGHTIILKTTNGTRALKRSSLAGEIYVGCFRNLGVLTDHLGKSDNEIVLVCAGWRGRLSMEDLLCAGNIIHELGEGNLPSDARDGAKVVFGLYEKFGNDIEKAVFSSNHAARLKDVVSEEDLRFCSQVSASDVLPAMHEGIISNIHGKEE